MSAHTTPPARPPQNYVTVVREGRDAVAFWIGSDEDPIRTRLSADKTFDMVVEETRRLAEIMGVPFVDADEHDPRDDEPHPGPIGFTNGDWIWPDHPDPEPVDVSPEALNKINPDDIPF